MNQNISNINSLTVSATYSQKLLMFDGLDGTFRTIRLRGRQPKCPLCGDSPVIQQLIDYEQFCGARASDKVQNFLLKLRLKVI